MLNTNVWKVLLCILNESQFVRSKRANVLTRKYKCIDLMYSEWKVWICLCLMGLTAFAEINSFKMPLYQLYLIVCWIQEAKLGPFLFMFYEIQMHWLNVFRMKGLDMPMLDGFEGICWNKFFQNAIVSIVFGRVLNLGGITWPILVYVWSHLAGRFTQVPLLKIVFNLICLILCQEPAVAPFTKFGLAGKRARIVNYMQRSYGVSSLIHHLLKRQFR